MGTFSEVGQVSSISIETASAVHVHISCIFSNVETVFLSSPSTRNAGLVCTTLMIVLQAVTLIAAIFPTYDLAETLLNELKTRLESIMLLNLPIMLFGIAYKISLLCSFLCFSYSNYAPIF